ncbi:MAG TPA: PQQ-dependent dehydrogenase, methanol/ethanol family, partial [Gammaproteobacteria bacterium]|nr:PQQ-dependent dehydrogenase, methanol/ethanol family [Gammaproteobacteria bacterium]
MKHFHYNVVVLKNHKITTKIAAILLCITLCPLNSLVLASDFDITQQRVIESTNQPDQWLVHGRTYAEQRYSPLNQINTETVKNLGIAWVFETDTNRGHEATPIVVDDIMFSTSAWSIVYANDAKTGEMIWKFDPKVPKEKAYFVCCDVVNRGVAVWQGKVFLGTIDGRLIALDAKTGEMIWEKMTVNPSQAYSITGAPRVVKNKV